MSENNQKTVEERLLEIETIIGKLESNQLDLQESLKTFEKGVQLIREANEELTAVSEKLKVLTDNGELNDL